MTLDVKTTSKGIVFKVHVQPRASADQIAGCHQDALKVRLTAPPADGRANKACLKFLAGRLKIAKSDMEIISGAGSRDKKILIHLPDTNNSAQAADIIIKRLNTLAR
ncbi:MAG: DUF167 domain-containing protein [Desulfobacterales bacterium]